MLLLQPRGTFPHSRCLFIMLVKFMQACSGLHIRWGSGLLGESPRELLPRQSE